MTKHKTTADTHAEQTYPGMAINEADNDKATKKLVDERTCALNNNPRRGDYNADSGDIAAPADKI